MCLTIPGRRVRIEGSDPLTRTGVVEYGGALRRTVQLLYLPEAREGDWVLVHAGVATGRVAEAEAREALAHAETIAGLIGPTAVPAGAESAGGS